MQKKIILGTDGKHFTLSTGEHSIYIKNVIFNMQEGKAHLEFDDIPIEDVGFSRNIDKSNKELQKVIADEEYLQSALDFFAVYGGEKTTP